MEEITLTFPQPLNVSVQVGDTAYFTNDVNGENIAKLGVITAVTTYTITVLVSGFTARPTTSSFILFSKTADVNTSGLKGYYAEAQFKNDSTEYAELFLVGSEIFESSK